MSDESIKFPRIGVIIPILFGVYLPWLIFGKPVIKIIKPEREYKIILPYENISQNENALTDYEQAARLMKKSDYPKELFDKEYTSANDKDKQAIKIWLSKQTKIFELIKRGNNKKHFFRTFDTQDPQSADALLSIADDEYRKIASALLWRAYLNAEEKNFDSAINCLIDTYRFGRHLKGKNLLIEQLIGMSIENKAASAIKAMLLHIYLPKDVLKQLQSALQKEIAKDTFVFDYELEKITIQMHMDTLLFLTHNLMGNLYIRRVHTGAAFLVCDADMDSSQIIRLLRILFVPVDRTKLMQSIDRIYNIFQDYAQKTPAYIHSHNIDIEKEISVKLAYNFFLKPFVYPCSHVATTAYENKAYVTSSLIIIALHRYYEDKGFFPEKLEELKQAGYLDSIPIDPFSDVPFAYRQKNCKEFMLYSFSLNCKDDGGVWPKMTQKCANPWRQTGDVIFLKLRKK